MVTFYLTGCGIKANLILSVFRNALVIVLLLMCFSIQAAKRDTIFKNSDTSKYIPASKTISSPANEQLGKKIIQGFNKIELKDNILTKLNRAAKRVHSSSVASYLSYLINLAHQNDIYFALFILIFYFLILNLFIGIYLLISKLRSNYIEKTRTRLEKKYNDIIAGYLFQESDDQSVPAILTKQKSLSRKNILINLMVRLQSDLEGDVTQRLHYLYCNLKLDQVSFRKIRRGRWNVKIQGFRELANMDVKEAIDPIRKYIRNSNDELRSEALIALIRIDKKNPFSFLDELTAPLTKWEQLNIFSFAKKYMGEIPSFNKWLSHKNITIVHFALTMIGLYQQLEAMDDIIKLFRHQDPEIRKLSIKLIGEFRSFNHESLLRDIYPQESEENKLEIIQALRKIPDVSQIDFFDKILIESSSYPIMIEVSKALLELGPKGKETLDLIREKMAPRLDPIYYHIIDKRI